MDRSFDRQESELVAEGASPSPVTVWALVVLDGPSRQVQGVVGPFRSPGYAQLYATGRSLADWLIVPALFLTQSTGSASIGVAVL